MLYANKIQQKYNFFFNKLGISKIFMGCNIQCYALWILQRSICSYSSGILNYSPLFSRI